MKKIKSIIPISLLIMGLSSIVLINKNSDDTLTSNISNLDNVKIEDETNEIDMAPDKDLTLSEMTEDRIYYRYVYDENLSFEENREAQIKKFREEVSKEICKDRGCTLDDFERIPEEDVISSGIINENGEIEIK